MTTYTHKVGNLAVDVSRNSAGRYEWKVYTASDRVLATGVDYISLTMAIENGCATARAMAKEER